MKPSFLNAVPQLENYEIQLQDPAQPYYLLAQADEHGGEHAVDEHAEEAGAEPAQDEHDAHAAEAAEHNEEEAAHGGHDEHAAEGAHDEDTFQMPDEFPNIYTWISTLRAKPVDDPNVHEEGHHLPWFVNPMFSFGYAAFFLIIVTRILRNRSIEKPSKPQLAIEALFGGLYGFFKDIVGHDRARQFVPFVGTLWIFILLNNWFGLIPMFKSPTAYFQTTIGLGICTFIFVNYNGIKEGGIGHYLWHLCGSPVGVIGWGLAPLMFVLETVGTLVKPVSLSLRLYGNIFGEDKLLASFLGLGLALAAIALKNPHPPIGLPLHLPFLFLATLTSVIQATVFSMLAAVYVSMLMPHDHDHEEGHGEAGAESH